MAKTPFLIGIIIGVIKTALNLLQKKGILSLFSPRILNLIALRTNPLNYSGGRVNATIRIHLCEILLPKYVF